MWLAHAFVHTFIDRPYSKKWLWPAGQLWILLPVRIQAFPRRSADVVPHAVFHTHLDFSGASIIERCKLSQP